MNLLKVRAFFIKKGIKKLVQKRKGEMFYVSQYDIILYTAKWKTSIFIMRKV